MKVTRYWPTLCLLLGTAFPGAACSGIEADLDKLEEQRYAAVMSGDWATVDALMGDEFFYNQGTGAVQTKAEYLAFMKSAVKLTKVVRSETSVVELPGNMAVVSGVLNVDVILKGRDEVLHPVERYLHVWAKRGTQWKLVARQVSFVPEKK